MTEFSGRTKRCLEQSGWTLDRSIDITSFTQILEGEGYHVSKAVKDFLTSFGGLRVEHPHAKAPESMDFFTLNPIEATAGICRERVETYEERTCKQLCVIGEAFRGYMTLMMSDDGMVYAAYDDLMVRVGSSGKDAIDALCNGRELERLP
jgi:hypothetical protein